MRSEQAPGSVRLLRRLSKTSWGSELFLAQVQLSSGRQETCALKVLDGSEQNVEGALHAAQQATMLDHPNIIRTFATGTLPKKGPFIAMELVRGVRLEQLVQRFASRGRWIPQKVSLYLLDQLWEGLIYLHSRCSETVRSLAPHQLQVDHHGLLRMMPLGSKNCSSFSYISPEICFGRKTDQRSDLFVVGIVAFELLFRMHPFRVSADRPTPLQILAAITKEDPHPVPGNNRPLKQFFQRLLARDPGDRYDTAAEARHDFWRLFPDARSHGFRSTMQRQVAMLVGRPKKRRHGTTRSS